MIDPTAPTSLSALKIVPTGGAQLGNFRVGTVLNLQVLAPLSAGQYQASLGGQKVTLQANQGLPLNSNLKVQVTRSGEQPEIRLLPQQQSPAAAGSNALRISLPLQRSLAQLAPDLQRLIAQPETGVTKQLQALVKALPSARDLTLPQQLKQQVENSGVFLEAKLSRLLDGRTPNLTADLKAALIKVFNQLELQPRAQTTTRPVVTKPAVDPSIKTTEQLLGKPAQATTSQQTTAEGALVKSQTQLIQGLLARIETLQLSNRVDTPNQLRVDLPLAPGETGTGNLVHLSFIAPEQTDRTTPDAEQEAQEEAPESWQVAIEWQSEGLGPSSARVWLSGEQVHIRIGLSKQPPEELTSSALEQLRERLTEQNLVVGNLILEQYQATPEMPPNPLLKDQGI